jgi:hypothetical protein
VESTLTRPGVPAICFNMLIGCGSVQFQWVVDLCNCFKSPLAIASRVGADGSRMRLHQVIHCVPCKELDADGLFAMMIATLHDKSPGLSSKRFFTLLKKLICAQVYVFLHPCLTHFLPLRFSKGVCLCLLCLQACIDLSRCDLLWLCYVQQELLMLMFLRLPRVGEVPMALRGSCVGR